MSTVFVDTSYLLALELADDQNHRAATAYWQQLVKQKPLPELITTSYVFDEVVTFFNSRHHHDKAVRIGNSLLQSRSVQLIHVDQALFYAAWDYLKKHQDKTYSLTDCISFVCMQQRKIETALSFDAHFRQAGFKVEP